MAIVRERRWHPLNEPDDVNEILLTIWMKPIPGGPQRYEHFSIDRRAKPKEIIAELKKLSRVFPGEIDHIETKRRFFGGLVSGATFWPGDPFDLEKALLKRFHEMGISNTKAEILWWQLLWMRLTTPFRKLRDLLT